ncbi:MAG TPA: hypothetical protein VGH28_24755 [Polyangiaceae bacterium]
MARYARVLAAHGEAFEGAELVTPTGKHFPDHFARDAKSLGRLLARVVSYTPLGEDVPLEIGLIEGEGDDGHCTSGCSKPGARVDGVARVGDGYRVPLPLTETGSATRLVCALARGVSAAVLAEAGEEVEPREVGAWSEVFAVASGFGVVMLEGSYVYTNSCGGPSIHRGTAHSTSELAVLLAFFCAVTETPAKDARKHLGATQADAFDEAWAFVRKNESLVEKLREAPELLEGGAFSFEEKRGLFSRLLSRDERAPKPSADRPEKAVDPELRALVEEELG